MKVRVMFDYEPPENDIDEDDDSGLTEEAFDQIHDMIAGDIGGTNIDVSKVPA